MNSCERETFEAITPQLAAEWTRILSEEQSVHDLGQTPEWCSNWAETYRSAYQNLKIVREDSSVYPLMIRRFAGLRVLQWIGQGCGMESDYSGGGGSCKKLLGALIDSDDWDVAQLQLPHWQNECAMLVKTLLRYEKYLWTVDVADQSVVINLPNTFEDWLSTLAKTPRNHARRFVKNVDEGATRFEILTGADILPALDDLIANNRQQWNVLSRPEDAQFLKKTVQDLTHSPNLFLAQIVDDNCVPACCLGYCSGGFVFIHTAGIRREEYKGMAPGIALYSLLIREMIQRGMQTFDFCPGLEEYKFRLGGHWVPNHHIVFARNRLAYCRYRATRATASFFRSSRDLMRRKIGNS
ncbi:GNAT family N-acetyltransferase [Tichowtungia aerotolerans]|uniref:GNAT family N-acetyltransferase n=1 Tax=Tichowtungia aerotolerans TaxID=2697043 RepID=A0A6P1MC42_9BACT|nr:GNAT family N-acetyltransferase [Tichowtungia aerotolerans]QHI70673.1 GNAT family N-acetyltransferase [Tichowtungia aerotolerans]